MLAELDEDVVGRNLRFIDLMHAGVHDQYQLNLRQYKACSGYLVQALQLLNLGQRANVYMLQIP